MQLVMSFLLLTVCQWIKLLSRFAPVISSSTPPFFFPYVGILVATMKILLTRKQNCEAYYQASNQNFHCTSLHITSTLLRMSNSIDASKGSLWYVIWRSGTEDIAMNTDPLAFITCWRRGRSWWIQGSRLAREKSSPSIISSCFYYWELRVLTQGTTQTLWNPRQMARDEIWMN